MRASKAEVVRVSRRVIWRKNDGGGWLMMIIIIYEGPQSMTLQIVEARRVYFINLINYIFL